MKFCLSFGSYGKTFTSLSSYRWKKSAASYKKTAQPILKKNYLLAQGIIDQVEYEPKVCVIIKTLALKLEIFLCEG